MFRVSALALALTFSNAALADKWAVDYSATTVVFSVDASNAVVNGEIRRWTADIFTEGNDFASALIEARFDLTTIQTDFPLADPILHSAPWLNTQEFPEARFRSTELVQRAGDNATLLSGVLTLRGVSQPLSVHALWDLQDDRVVAEITGELDRLVFGVGDEASVAIADPVVTIEVRIEAVRQ